MPQVLRIASGASIIHEGFSRLKARHKHGRTIQCFIILREHPDLSEASLFDKVQVKSMVTLYYCQVLFHLKKHCINFLPVSSMDLSHVLQPRMKYLESRDDKHEKGEASWPIYFCGENSQYSLLRLISEDDAAGRLEWWGESQILTCGKAMKHGLNQTFSSMQPPYRSGGVILNPLQGLVVRYEGRTEWRDQAGAQ